MFTTRFDGQSSSTRRQFLGLITAALILLQPVLFASRSVYAQGGKKLPASHAGRISPPQPSDDGVPNDTGTGSVSLTTLGVAAPTETFVSLANTGIANMTLPTGWYLTESGGGARDLEDYAADTGGSATGDTYSYGAAATTERAFGGLQSGTLIPLFGARFTNNTGSTITSLDITYTGEQWRLGTAARTDRIDFQISTNATDLTTGTYTDVDTLDFTTPNTVAPTGAKDGNAAGNRTTMTSSIPGLSIPNGATFAIRWLDLNASGADDGLSVDDFSITPQGPGGGGVTLSINDVVQSEGNAGMTAFTFTVSLSTTVHGGVTFDIATADGTAQDDNPPAEDNDYTAISLIGQTIPNGSDTFQFTVNVNGDTTTEAAETFFVNVTNVTGATVADGQGQGTITNDDVALVAIHDIQGNGATSPIPGANVTTTGIVTLLKTGSNGGAGVANGFFLQTPDADADADPNTSEGIFVFTSTVPTYTAGGPVAVGDELTVTGTVVEFNGLTEIGTVTNITSIDTGNPLPTAVTITAADLPSNALPTQPQLEKYEGMRLSAASLLGVVPNDNFFDVETVLSTVPRQQVFREPGIPVSDPIPPDPTTGVPDCCIAIWDENPERLKIDTNGRAGAPNNPYTSNVTFTNVSGPLDFGFGEYRLIPDAPPAASGNMSAIPVPSPNANEFTVAGYNIENFNNNATQREKAALTIRTVLLYPDIIGAIEIFDLADLQALRDEINNDAVAAGDPNPMYEAFLIEQDGTSEDSDQDVGYLVKTARVQVTSVTQEREEETFVEPGGGTAILHDRPPLVLDAIVDPSGPNPQRVLVVVNHLRSFIDADLVAGDGPRVREKRKKQAESTAGLLQELQTNNPSTPVISVGDYNAFQFSSGLDDSVSVLKGNPTPDDQIVVDQSPDLVDPNFFNLLDELPANERYSFVFEGTPQTLDHHLVNTAARARNTRIAVSRVNADFPEVPASAFASDAARPERNSDHDPVVSYYALGAQQQAGTVLISEFRLRGPDQGLQESPLGIFPPVASLNEFVEIYNNTSADITVSTTDGSTGWAVVGSNGIVLFEIPVDATIPARGHYLGTNQLGYTLRNYGGFFAANGDTTYLTDTPDNGGVALFRTSNPLNFNLAERLDAVGYSDAPPLYREGAGIAPGGPEFANPVAEFSYFRDMRTPGAFPKDTGNNVADFLAASVDAFGGAGLLGAPGPENLFSPINRNSGFGVALIDTGVAGSAPPNRVRKPCGLSEECDPNRSAFGTMSVRRTYTNNTGAPVSKLRFRVMDITTFPPPNGTTADLRAISSGDVPGVPVSQGGTVDVFGTTVEEPPDQPSGGGWHSSLNVDSIDLGFPLGDGESISIQFLLGVQRTGSFRFFISIEAITDQGKGTFSRPKPRRNRR